VELPNLPSLKQLVVACEKFFRAKSVAIRTMGKSAESPALVSGKYMDKDRGRLTCETALMRRAGVTRLALAELHESLSELDGSWH
jgi:hypothetical protein